MLLDLRAAPAQPDQAEVKRARAIAAQGFAAYDRKEYAAAISLFSRAYEIAPEAGLLYNIAQAYRQIGPAACDEALSYYRRFLTAPESARGQVTSDTVEARISEMEECVEARRAEGENSSAAPGASQPSLDIDGGETDDGGDGRTRRTAGWIVVGAGGATLALAAGATAMALRRRSQLDEGCSGGVCPSDLEDEVRSYDRWRYTAFVSGGAGVVAVGVGIWMLVTAHRSERGAGRGGTTAGVAPWVGPEGIGVSLWF